MSPRRRAPWIALLVVAAAVVAGLPGRGGLLVDGEPALAAATIATASPRSARALPVPPVPVPPVPVPSVPLPLVPPSPRIVSPLPVPSLPVPPLPLPVLPLPVPPSVRSVPPVPPGLGLPPLGRRLAAGALPLAPGPTDTRPGPGPSFTLEARSVTLNGVRLRGLATPPGRRTPARDPVLRIDVDDATLTAPVIRARHADRGVVEARSRQVARLAGRGQLYLEEITGTLAVAGLPTVPVRLSPGELTTPGVDLGFLAVPSLTFTDVTARVAFLQAGRLSIPGATFVASVPPS